MCLLGQTGNTELIYKASNLKSVVDKNMEKLYISDALEEIFNFLRECNKYIDGDALFCMDCIKDAMK